METEDVYSYSDVSFPFPDIPLWWFHFHEFCFNIRQLRLLVVQCMPG